MIDRRLPVLSLLAANYANYANFFRLVGFVARVDLAFGLKRSVTDLKSKPTDILLAWR